MKVQFQGKTYEFIPRRETTREDLQYAVDVGGYLVRDARGEHLAIYNYGFGWEVEE